jgi:hypothetical protein
MKVNIFLAHSARLLLVLLFSASCSKDNAGPAHEGQPVSIPLSGLQHVIVPDVTIDSAKNYVFSLPLITQAILTSGTVVVYATSTEDQIPQWQSLPIVTGCHQRLEVVSVSLGRVEVQNDLGAPLSMSFRFDIVPGD